MSETTSRTLDLLNLLQTHRQWSGPELAERLGVTERTLRRDVERLRELGYRVEAARGAAGGYRLEAGSVLPPLLLTDDEAVTMAIGLRVAATHGLADGALASQTALAKFEQVLPARLRHRISALATAIQPEVARGPTISQDSLGQLALACRDSERVRFHYVSAGGDETERLVEPHSLVAADRRWFLVAWDLDRDDWRTFRVDRLSRFFATRVRFEHRALPAPDAPTYVSRQADLLRQRIRAEVVLHLTLEQTRAYFQNWAADAVALTPETTLWPIWGDSIESLISMLLWIPREAAYQLRAPPDVLAAVQEASARLAKGLM